MMDHARYCPTAVNHDPMLSLLFRLMRKTPLQIPNRFVSTSHLEYVTRSNVFDVVSCRCSCSPRSFQTEERFDVAIKSSSLASLRRPSRENVFREIAVMVRDALLVTVIANPMHHFSLQYTSGDETMEIRRYRCHKERRKPCIQ